jgi:hypothetical protein
MRTPFFILVAGIALTATAQDQAKPQELDKDDQVRIRAERSAGGTGNITPEEKANANVGAGPHQDRHTDAARREPRADSSKGLESKDERRDTRRP